MVRKKINILTIGRAALFAATIVTTPNLFASAYKDSPQQANSPATDISDFYMFRSWEDPSKVVFILNVNAGQNPQDGPGLSNFDDDAVYRINIDNNMDGKANDVVYEFRFRSKIREVDNFPKFPFSCGCSPTVTVS